MNLEVRPITLTSLDRALTEALTRQVSTFTPSPVKRIQFGNGKVFPMNRAERRRQHIYNRNLKPVKRG